MTQPALNIVPFVSVDRMMKLVLAIGVERFLTELAAYIEEDFRRWELFDKTPRIASHSHDGVIELMPTSDGQPLWLQICQRPSQEHARGPARPSPPSACSPMSAPAIRCCSPK